LKEEEEGTTEAIREKKIRGALIPCENIGMKD
jgi:hypothetical protein